MLAVLLSADSTREGATALLQALAPAIDDLPSALAVRDRFDDWVTTRDRREEGLVASRYVPSDMTGYEDLDQYGNWVEDREYGTVWFPRAVPVGWAAFLVIGPVQLALSSVAPRLHVSLGRRGARPGYTISAPQAPDSTRT